MNRNLVAVCILALLQCSSLALADVAPAAVAPSVAVAVSATTATDASKSAAMPKEIHWVRDSAEYRACLVQAYRQAAAEIDRKAGELTSGTWAVVLDADETVIDNSQFQKELAEKGAGYSSGAWKAWCLRGEATALPGSVGFLKHVQGLGGKVVIITNRSTDVQEVTERNFHSEGIPYDLMLCKTGSSEKEARNESVERGTAAPGLPPLKIVMWVGDNVQDFPGMRQGIRSGDDESYSGFGSRYIIMPNPMYGSWERNPAR
jgi:5'-nucleotidase (lipoprotein e(P4) family)